jgi:hypothetical protein
MPEVEDVVVECSNRCAIGRLAKGAAPALGIARHAIDAVIQREHTAR